MRLRKIGLYRQNFTEVVNCFLVHFLVAKDHASIVECVDMGPFNIYRCCVVSQSLF